MNSSHLTDKQALGYLLGLSELIQEQIEIACADVVQTGQLLDDAIDQLNASFQALGEGLIQPSPATDTSWLVPHVHSAITGLQFHDMTDQLLRRIKIRLQDVQEIVSNSLVTNEHTTDWDKSMELLAEQRTAIQKQLRGSLRQTSLDTGDVELF